VSPLAPAVVPQTSPAVDPGPALTVVRLDPDALSVTAIGPVLDYLYSRSVSYRVRCTADGFAIDADIRQLADQRTIHQQP
jgi:hypothetical protein